MFLFNDIVSAAEEPIGI